MECAALFSPLVIQSSETASGYGFGERRVRPLCHLVVACRPERKHKLRSSRWSADVIANAISKLGISPASSAGQATGQFRGSIDFPFGEHRPGYARQLIRQSHADNIVMCARCQVCQPGTETGRLLLSKLQNCACALYEQSSQIAVPAFADAEQFLFASGGVFARH